MRYPMWLILLLIVLISGVLTSAQDEQADTEEPIDMNERFSLQVFVDSAFIREDPIRDAEPAASTFENDVLTALGRNTDGTWFEVRRPQRNESLGWISNTVVSFTFEVAQLPITDFTTGVTGDTPVFDSGISVLFFAEAVLRDDPERGDNRLGVVPRGVTIPALERSPDNTWLLVNYNGQTGWIAEFLTNTTSDLDDLPIAAQYLARLDEAANLPIIPPEVQLAQVNRLREYITPLIEISAIVADFWGLVRTGETVPCEPPSDGGFIRFSITQDDLFELPELRRYQRRLNQATSDLNSTLEIMQDCGVFSTDDVSRAYGQAVNSTIIFTSILGNLDFLEEEVIPAPQE